MAFASISNRLWLTYLLIVVLVLLIAFAGIVIAFQRSPILYRQVFYQISLVHNFLKERLGDILETEWPPFIRLFLNEVKVSDIKIAIYDREGEILHLSADTHLSDLPEVNNPMGLAEKSENRILAYRDAQKEFWFYQFSQINEEYFVLTAAKRPHVSISVLFQDELLRPLFRAGVIALLLSFLLGWLIARWITRPLEKISASAAEIARGHYVMVPMEGPAEVRQLARTMNDMVVKVQDSLESQHDFVANVSHEFKTPLTSIQGFAQALVDDAIVNKKERKKAAQIILDETDRLNHLVNDLLALARWDAGTVAVHKSKTDLHRMIGNILERFQFQITGKNLTVHTSLEGPAFLKVDGEKMSQVFINLIDNAIKFSPDGTEIGIRTQREDDSVAITIQDSGPGILPEDQKRIFERFFQVDKARRGGAGRGVGLGLAIARQITRAHGGDIQITSQPGSGSAFVVKLPFDDDRQKN